MQKTHGMKPNKIVPCGKEGVAKELQAAAPAAPAVKKKAVKVMKK